MIKIVFLSFIVKRVICLKLQLAKKSRKCFCMEQVLKVSTLNFKNTRGISEKIIIISRVLFWFYWPPLPPIHIFNISGFIHYGKLLTSCRHQSYENVKLNKTSWKNLYKKGKNDENCIEKNYIVLFSLKTPNYKLLTKF